MMLAATAGGTTLYPRAQFVGLLSMEASGVSSGATVYDTVPLASTGAVAGDYCMIQVAEASNDSYPLIQGGSGGWTQDNYTWTPSYGYRQSVLHKRLTAFDLSDTVQIGHSGTSGVTPAVDVLIYRNPSAAERKTIRYEDDGNTTHTTPGFTKSGLCIGVVAFLVDRDVSGGTGTTEAITGGAIVERIERASSFFRVNAADALGKTDYPDGASIDWSGLSNTGPYGEVSMLYELRI